MENDEWMQDQMFYLDTMSHIQTLNLALQEKDKIISDFTQIV